MNEYPHTYRPPLERPKVLLPAVLFLLTVLTTVAAGALQQGANIFSDPALLYKGVPFSASLLFILGTHEIGHFIASRRHGISTTLPTFIPGPPIPPLPGTFGAVIRIKSPITTKSALVDIGAAGPLSGFIVALFVTAWGLDHSTVIHKGAAAGAMGLGSSLIFQLLSYITIGSLPDNYEVMLNPVAFAGWFGMFVTAMNLIPVGQLDGGHLACAVLGRNHRIFSRIVVALLVVTGLLFWFGWIVWAVLITLIGTDHPPVEDQHEPMDKRRRLVCVAALAVFVLTFIPMPFYII